MKKVPVLITLLAIIAISVIVTHKQSKKIDSAKSDELIVYAYSSFVASWGAGPQLQKTFQELTGSKLRLVDVGDTGLMLTKMDKEGVAAADVWLGMDRALAEEASIRYKWWTPEQPSFSLAKGLALSDFQIEGMIAFDWAPLAFIYNSKKISKPNYLDVIDGKYKRQVTAPEPSLSPLGLELIRWLVTRKGGEEPINKLKDLKKAEFLYGRSWSQSYGIFQKGEAAMSWSFITSPVYHWIEEKNESYQPLVMEEGHPYIVEYFGIPAESQNKVLAQKFVDMILSFESQQLIMNKNYMFPIRDGVTSGTRFSELPNVKLVSPLIEADATLALWKTVQ